MKKIIIVVLTLMTFISCECEVECSAYDNSSELTPWFLFPENKEEYNFQSESTGDFITLKKDFYETTESPYITKLSCGFGVQPDPYECETFLSARYRSDNLKIENRIDQYDIGNSILRENFSIVLEESSLESDFKVDFGDGEFEEDQSAFIESIDIKGQIYNNIRLFEFNDNSEGSIYVSKEIGMIRITLDNQTYDIIE